MKSLVEIAVRENYLTKEQVDELLKQQSDSYMYFGEALVRIGVISDEDIISELKEFNRLKIQRGEKTFL